MTLLARGLVPARTASGIPTITVMPTAMPVTISRSMESCQKPKTPKERNESRTRRAIRQLAMA